MMLCLQLGTTRKWFCLTLSALIYRKSMSAPILLDVINIRDSCTKSSHIWSSNLAGAGLGWICQKGPDARPAGVKIWYIPTKHRWCSKLEVSNEQFSWFSLTIHWHLPDFPLIPHHFPDSYQIPTFPSFPGKRSPWFVKMSTTNGIPLKLTVKWHKWSQPYQQSYCYNACRVTTKS